MKKIEGIPSSSRARARCATREIKTRDELVSVERKEAPAGAFDVPADFQKKPFDLRNTMGGGRGPGGGRGRRRRARGRRRGDVARGAREGGAPPASKPAEKPAEKPPGRNRVDGGGAPASCDASRASVDCQSSESWHP